MSSHSHATTGFASEGTWVQPSEVEKGHARQHLSRSEQTGTLRVAVASSVPVGDRRIIYAGLSTLAAENRVTKTRQDTAAGHVLSWARLAPMTSFSREMSHFSRE